MSTPGVGLTLNWTRTFLLTFTCVPLLPNFWLIQILLCWIELSMENIRIRLHLLIPDSAIEKTVQSTAIFKIIPRESYPRKKSNHRGIWCPERHTVFYGQNLEGWMTCPGDSLLFTKHWDKVHMASRPFCSGLPCDQNKSYHCPSRVHKPLTFVPDNAWRRKSRQSGYIFYPQMNYVCTTRANSAEPHITLPGDSRECVAPAYSHSPRWMLRSLESLSSIPHNLICGQKFLPDAPYSLG